MKITKYEHACLDIEEQGKRLLVDPGTFTTSIPNFDNVIVVVVTHVHGDHLDVEKLKAIRNTHPDVPIFTVQTVADEIGDEVPVTVVTGGQKAEAGPFKLDFFGGQHAIIHSSIPVTDNIGVMVNDILYYPGDSYSLPHKPVDTLVVPANAPWMRVGESMDFIAAIKPKRAFPTHNALLSSAGAGLANNLLEAASSSVGAKYLVLETGDSLSV